MISTDISDDSVVHFLRTVGPILDFQLDLQRSATPSLWLVCADADIVVVVSLGLGRKHELIDALQELRMQEEDVGFLEAECDTPTTPWASGNCPHLSAVVLSHCPHCRCCWRQVC